MTKKNKTISYNICPDDKIEFTFDKDKKFVLHYKGDEKKGFFHNIAYIIKVIIDGEKNIISFEF